MLQDDQHSMANVLAFMNNTGASYSTYMIFFIISETSSYVIML